MLSMAADFSSVLYPLVSSAEGKPEPHPGGEGDPGGVGPAGDFLGAVRAHHPGGAGGVGHLLLCAPAIPPAHERETLRLGH